MTPYLSQTPFLDGMGSGVSIGLTQTDHQTVVVASRCTDHTMHNGAKVRRVARMLKQMNRSDVT